MRFRPNVLKGFGEEAWEIIDVGCSDQAGLITLRLERFLGRVRLVNGAEGARDPSRRWIRESSFPCLSGPPDTHGVDNEPGNVFDHASGGDDVTLFILQHDSNLGPGDMQSPHTGGKGWCTRLVHCKYTARTWTK